MAPLPALGQPEVLLTWHCLFDFKAHRTYTRKAKSKQPVRCALFAVFGNFHYTDTIVGERSSALMFQANIGPALLYGVDYLRMGPEDQAPG